MRAAFSSSVDGQIHLIGDEVVQSQDEVRRLAHAAPVDPAAFDELVALPGLAGREADEKREEHAEDDAVALHHLGEKRLNDPIPLALRAKNELDATRERRRGRRDTR